MKKAIFKGFAVAALALAVLFTGCKNEPSNIETISTDAVEITAKAYPGYNYITWTIPENFQDRDVSILRDDGKTISAVPSGGHYAIDVDIKDGVTYKYTAYVAAPDAGSLEYQYKFAGADAGSLSDVSTDVKGVLYVGNSSSASCKAINPVCIKDGKLMAALDLCEYEDGGDADYVINEENIIFERFYDDAEKYAIAFPTKEYLNYSIQLYKGNALELFDEKATAYAFNANGVTGETAFAAVTSTADTDSYLDSPTTIAKGYYTNDTAVRYNGVITTAGEYTVKVKVTALNKSYNPSYVVSKNKFTVKALDTKVATGAPKAGYIDENKIRLIWTPAQKADESLWSVDSYKVYVKDSFGVYTEIAPAKVAKVDEEGEEVKDDDGNVIMETTLPIAQGLQANDDVYYIDYVVGEKNNVSYSFYVVLSDNGMVESAEKTVTVGRFYDPANNVVSFNTNNVTAAFYALEKDTLSNDAVLTVTLNNNNKALADQQSVKAYYLVLDKNAKAGYLGLGTNSNNQTINKLWLDNDFTEFTASNPASTVDYTRYDFIKKDVPVDSAVIFLYKISQKGYEDFWGYKVIDNPVSSIINGSAQNEFDVSVRTNNESEADMQANPKVTITVVPANQDTFANYTWTISYAKLDVEAAIAENEGKFVTYENITTWKDGPAVKIAWDKDEGDYRFTKKDFELPVTTLASEIDADNHADTGAVKDGTYKDYYVFKVVKTNTKADKEATGNQVVYYVTKGPYTKNAK